MDANFEQLKALFPTPEPDFPTLVVPNPTRHAGWTHESTEAVLNLLRDNHHRWHIFFNENKFHNHATHHLLAIYAMGANDALLKAAYETHTVYQRAAFPPPAEGDAKEKQASKGVINETNWKEHLGDERYYQAYVAFFSSLLLEKNKSISSVLEEFVFSKDANIIPGKNGSKPLMLSRFLGGFIHPLIHAGYGTEFNLPGLVVEGLAEGAAEPTDAASFFTDDLWTGSVQGIATKLSSLVVSTKQTEDVHALTVLARVAKDPELAAKVLGLAGGNPAVAVEKVVEVATEKIAAHADAWMKTVLPERTVIRRKFEELIWMNAVIYGVGGWAGRAQGKDTKGAFAADFFFMHLVTSSLMVTSIINTISLSSASLLLRTYFVVSLVLYVSRGRPPLLISAFYASTTSMPTPPPTNIKPEAGTLEPSEAPNPWLPIIQTTLVHPSEHLCKLQRSLLHFAEVYGGAAPGTFAGVPELEGAEVLDGTLFIRAAGLTADRLGWKREGQGIRSKESEKLKIEADEMRAWDFTGFYGLQA